MEHRGRFCGRDGDHGRGGGAVGSDTERGAGAIVPSPAGAGGALRPSCGFDFGLTAAVNGWSRNGGGALNEYLRVG